MRVMQHRTGAKTSTATKPPLQSFESYSRTSKAAPAAAVDSRVTAAAASKPTASYSAASKPSGSVDWLDDLLAESEGALKMTGSAPAAPVSSGPASTPIPASGGKVRRVFAGLLSLFMLISLPLSTFMLQVHNCACGWPRG